MVRIQLQHNNTIVFEATVCMSELQTGGLVGRESVSPTTHRYMPAAAVGCPSHLLHLGMSSRDVFDGSTPNPKDIEGEKRIKTLLNYLHQDPT